MSDVEKVTLEKNPDIKHVKKRPKRIPLYKQKSLLATQRAGYTRRWVNVTDDRVERFKNAGWEPVEGAENDISDEASRHNIHGVRQRSVGQGMNAILMEIKNEYFEEDQRAKAERVQQIMRAYSPREAAKRDANRYDQSSL